MNLILNRSVVLTTCKSGKLLTHLLRAYHFIFLTVISACGGWRLMCSWPALHSCILGFGLLTFNLIGFLFWFMGGIRSSWILCFRKWEKKNLSEKKRKKISVECKSPTMFQEKDFVLIKWWTKECKENSPLLHCFITQD